MPRVLVLLQNRERQLDIEIWRTRQTRLPNKPFLFPCKPTITQKKKGRRRRRRRGVACCMHAKTRVETRKEDWVGGKKRLVMELPKREMLEDFAVIGGLVGVQVVYAGNALVLSYLMSVGLNPLSLVVYSAFATFIVLTPLSFYFERYPIPSPFFFFFSIFPLQNV